MLSAVSVTPPAPITGALIVRSGSTPFGSPAVRLTVLDPAITTFATVKKPSIVSMAIGALLVVTPAVDPIPRTEIAPGGIVRETALV